MWRNWLTRMVQVHVKAISWGFKSLHPHQKEQYPFGCCSFFVFHMGLEGRVSENSPVDCFPAPPLRPQAGKSLHPHKKLVERRAFFFFPLQNEKPEGPNAFGLSVSPNIRYQSVCDLPAVFSVSLQLLGQHGFLIDDSLINQHGIGHKNGK